jgi:hypothetical protein
MNGCYVLLAAPLVGMIAGTVLYFKFPKLAALSLRRSGTARKPKKGMFIHLVNAFTWTIIFRSILRHHRHGSSQGGH